MDVSVFEGAFPMRMLLLEFMQLQERNIKVIEKKTTMATASVGIRVKCGTGGCNEL